MADLRCNNCGQKVEGWFTLTAYMPEELRPVYEQAVGTLRKEGFELNSNRRVAAGQIIEALCAAYLAEAH